MCRPPTVVRDEDQRDAELFMQILQEVDHLSRERTVEAEKPGSSQISN